MFRNYEFAIRWFQWRLDIHAKHYRNVEHRWTGIQYTAEREMRDEECELDVQTRN